MSFPVDPAKYVAFLVTMSFLALSPGPANLFFIRTGLQGRKSRVFAGVIGTNSASLVWFIASALGLQVVMAAFPIVFRVVAVAGGAYIVWLGFKTFATALKIDNEKTPDTDRAPLPVKSNLATLREGFMVQILNPKALLFFSAVLPPFVDLQKPMPGQMLVFAATMMTLDAMSMSAYGLGAVHLSRWLSQPVYKQRFDLGAGAILMLIGLGVVLHAIATFSSV